jgi:hypothetical protein
MNPLTVTVGVMTTGARGFHQGHEPAGSTNRRDTLPQRRRARRHIGARGRGDRLLLLLGMPPQKKEAHGVPDGEANEQQPEEVNHDPQWPPRYNPSNAEYCGHYQNPNGESEDAEPCVHTAILLGTHRRM